MNVYDHVSGINGPFARTSLRKGSTCIKTAFASAVEAIVSFLGATSLLDFVLITDIVNVRLQAAIVVTHSPESFQFVSNRHFTRCLYLLL